MKSMLVWTAGLVLAVVVFTLGAVYWPEPERTGSVTDFRNSLHER